MNDMKKYIISMLVVITSAHCYGFSLNGTWQEDREKTIRWNSTNLKIDEESLEKLSAILGHMYLRFNDGVRCQFFEPYTMIYKGKERQVDRLITQHAQFEIIGENQYGFALKIIHPNKQVDIDSIIYENEDSFYVVSLTTEDYGFPGSRTYFKKVEPVKWSYDCK